MSRHIIDKELWKPNIHGMARGMRVNEVTVGYDCPLQEFLFQVTWENPLTGEEHTMEVNGALAKALNALQDYTKFPKASLPKLATMLEEEEDAGTRLSNRIVQWPKEGVSC